MARWKHGRAKPVIGILGGIGAGKSTVARLFGREGCGVIDSDVLAHEVLQSDEVKRELRAWLGDGIFEASGGVDRRALGRQVFADSGAIQRLNEMIHPRMAGPRDRLMEKMMSDRTVKAVVWDSPLLMEAGLDKECDALVFVQVPADIRLMRVQEKRGWTAQELSKRENLQIPLDKKAAIADYYVNNTGDEASCLAQVQRVLSHLFAASH